MTETPSPVHVRLPQRADAVEGKEGKPGAPPPTQRAPDARTATQDPVTKRHDLSNMRNWNDDIRR